MSDFNVTFEIPVNIDDVYSKEYRDAWLWAIGEILRLILQDAPDGVADFTGRTKAAFAPAIEYLQSIGGPVVESSYNPNPNYELDFLERRRAYLDARRPLQDVQIVFDENKFVTEFILTIPDVVFQAQNYSGDPSHENPQTPEPWDLITKAESIIRPLLKDRLVEALKARVRSRLRTRSK